MKNSLNYQKEYGKSYFEQFIAPQKTEKNKNFQAYLKLILAKKRNIKSVLDLGCGEGEFLKICSENNIKDLAGVDISEYAITKARKIKNAKITKVNLEKQPLSYKNAKFDLVVAIDIVEHVINTDFLFSEIFRVLKNNGLLFITTENHGSSFDKIFSPFFPRHSGHINLQKSSYWENKLKDPGFKRIDIKGILFHGFPPFLKLRNFLRHFKIPVIVDPIFFSFRDFTGTLVIFANKL